MCRLLLNLDRIDTLFYAHFIQIFERKNNILRLSTIVHRLFRYIIQFEVNE